MKFRNKAEALGFQTAFDRLRLANSQQAEAQKLFDTIVAELDITFDPSKIYRITESNELICVS